MKSIRNIARFLGVALILLIAGFALFLYVSPPDLIRIGSGYAAKIVCSNVFLAKRDAHQVLEVDVQAPGHPLLKLMRIKVDQDHGVVSAGLLGLFGNSQAVYRPGLGCALVPDGDLVKAQALRFSPVMTSLPDAPWPQGTKVSPIANQALDAVLQDKSLAGEGMRAIIIVKQGRIVGEAYGDGFSAETPLLGWSMTKSVTAAIIGTLIRDGKMDLTRQSLFGEWRNDDRAEIRLADLMAMSSGLEFNEDYGDVTDVTRMLYLEPDMAAFAADKPLVSAVGSVFSYSSGTTILLSRLWQQAAADQAISWPSRALFEPLGMRSATLEMDEAGTFAGSSYLYATARDWSRFGLLLLQAGQWNGKAILPPNYVAWMREPAPASSGKYGRGQVWLNSADRNLPKDTFWMRGHDGQFIAIIPSQDLVVVRLGLTPAKLAYSVSPLVAAALNVLKD